MTVYALCLNAFQINPVVSLYRPVSWLARRLFLAGLLDALLPSVHGALATSLLGHLLACLLVCIAVSMPPSS